MLRQRSGQIVLLILLVVLGVLYARARSTIKTLNEESQRAQSALLDSSGHSAIGYAFNSSAKDPTSLSALADVLDSELSRAEALIALSRQRVAPEAYANYAALPRPQQSVSLLRALASKKALDEADRRRVDEIVQAWNEYQFNTRLPYTQGLVSDPTNLTAEYGRLYLKLRAIGAEVFPP